MELIFHDVYQLIGNLAMISGHEMLMATYTPPRIIVDSADFDNIDHAELSGDLAGVVDSKKGIFSGRLRLDGGDSEEQTILASFHTLDGNSYKGFRVFRSSGNNLILVCTNSTWLLGTPILNISTTATFTTAATWIHFLASWDLAIGASFLYINDVSDKIVNIFTDDTIDYTQPDWGVGGTARGTHELFNGCLAEIYFAPGQYLDFSIIANRRRFTDATGKPVWLGADGSAPTGTAAAVYLHLDDAEAVENFVVNAGTGGTFNITGPLGTGSSSPSD